VVIAGLAVALACAGAALWSNARAAAQGAPAVKVQRWTSLDLEVQELALDNGFTILVVGDRRVPRVAASLYYRVGALLEHHGGHGSTHFLEHAIHQGTTTVGITDRAADEALLRQIHETEQQLIAERNARRNELRERDVFFDEGKWPSSDRLDQLRRRLYELEDEQSKHRIFWEEYNWYRRNGGLMRHTDPVPANTGNELMRIEVDLPKERLELFFRLEADRMVNAVLRGFEAQRYTVLEQFYILNRFDSGRFSEALNGVTGIAHPIFTHTGGHLRDHAYWDRASMLRIYDDYMVPNNATLTLVGAVTLDEVRVLAAKYFGAVPRGPAPPATMDVEVEPPPAGALRFDWMEPLHPQLIVRYRIPAVGHPDRPVFDVLARLLRGRGGLLAAAQVGAPVGGEWQASATQNGAPSILTVQSRAARDEDLPALEQVALAAIERVRRDGVDDERLKRVQRELRLEWELLRAERGSLASQLGGFAVMDEWRTFGSFVEARHAVKPEDVQRVAQRYLVPSNQVIATTRLNPRSRAEHSINGPAPVPSPATGRPR
jgi:predicted Zn-dependent peptidase